MKKIVFLVLFFMVLTGAFAQNVTFNGYWELPDGNILLVKERIFLFVKPDGNLWGGTGGFAATTRQFTLQQPGQDGINTDTFNYTVIDSGSIRVTNTSGNEWANGTWRKRTNIPGTRLNHRILGYWEGRDGDTTRILYFAGSDIVPARDLRNFYGSYYNGQSWQPDGWLYDFDRENNLVRIHLLGFEERMGIYAGFDTTPGAFRFDGANLFVGRFWFDTPGQEIRFVRK